ncbi:SRPBCC domain-containing protein [Micromonospora sp. NPDC050397]|uniref:SRPBCC family protein n=1 Tax=Micromonospora sp. NPDC050397 TaxID=3364279 RepID=UPI0038514546
MTAEPSERIVARVTHDFTVSPETVFDAWLDAKLVRQWMAASIAESAPGTEMRTVSIDARVGGTFTFTDSRDEDETGPTGTYLQIDRPRRLAFTWLPEPGEHSVVTIDIEPTSTGCTLTLVHEMEPTWADYLDQTTAAWVRMANHIDRMLTPRP